MCVCVCVCVCVYVVCEQWCVVHGCVVCGCVNGLRTIMCMCMAVEGLKNSDLTQGS